MKKFSQELASELKKAITKNKEIIEKATKDNGTFKVVMTTSAKDRMGEIVLQEGIEIENYLKNPIVLYAHDYSKLPIGKVTSIEQKSDKMIGEGVFVSEKANPEAQKIRRLYDEGVLNAVSIGFIGKEWEGNVITQSELLELSFVPVPANQQALRLAVEKGIITEKEMKNFTIENESKELVATKKLVSVIKDLVGKFKDIEKSIKNLDEKVVGISNQVTKGEVQKGAEIKELLSDTNSATQMISRIADSVNKKFNKIK